MYIICMTLNLKFLISWDLTENIQFYISYIHLKPTEQGYSVVFFLLSCC